MKTNIDQKISPQSHSFKRGDHILVKAQLVNKSINLYDPFSHKIWFVNGSMITAARYDHLITSNSSFFFKVIEKEVFKPSPKELDFVPINEPISTLSTH
jgi:hypothetical protein